MRPLDDAERARMTGTSWHPGCPVGLDDLRAVEARHHDAAGGVASGLLVVHADQADAVLGVLAALYAHGFPIARMEPVSAFGGDDARSMAANNTSGFNCRRISGTDVWSEHAHGRAIDLNPLWNPWVRTAGDRVVVAPEAGRPFVDRTTAQPGVVRDGDAVVAAFAAIGWSWGGRWQRTKDYQHFSATGR